MYPGSAVSGFTSFPSPTICWAPAATTPATCDIISTATPVSVISDSQPTPPADRYTKLLNLKPTSTKGQWDTNYQSTSDTNIPSPTEPPCPPEHSEEAKYSQAKCSGGTTYIHNGDNNYNSRDSSGYKNGDGGRFDGGGRSYLAYSAAGVPLCGLAALGTHYKFGSQKSLTSQTPAELMAATVDTGKKSLATLQETISKQATDAWNGVWTWGQGIVANTLVTQTKTFMENLPKLVLGYIKDAAVWVKKKTISAYNTTRDVFSTWMGWPTETNRGKDSEPPGDQRPKDIESSEETGSKRSTEEIVVDTMMSAGGGFIGDRPGGGPTPTT